MLRGVTYHTQQPQTVFRRMRIERKSETTI